MRSYLIEYTLCNGISFKASIKAMNDADALDRVCDYIDDRHAPDTLSYNVKILKRGL